MSKLTLVSMALSIVTALAASTSYADWGCQDAATAALQAKGVTNAIFLKTDPVQQNGPIQGFIEWYTLPDCQNSGYLVVNTSASCSVQQIYTMYGCNVSGIDHY